MLNYLKRCASFSDRIVVEKRKPTADLQISHLSTPFSSVIHSSDGGRRDHTRRALELLYYSN